MQSNFHKSVFVIIFLIGIIYYQLTIISKNDAVLLWTVLGSISQAAAALGTFWAVKTTLSLAAKENEAKIKITLSLKYEQIEVSIINLGKYPVTLLPYGYLHYKGSERSISHNEISIEDYDNFLKPNQYLTLTYRSDYIYTMFKDMNIPKNIAIPIIFYDKELNKYYSSQKLILKREESIICIHQS